MRKLITAALIVVAAALAGGIGMNMSGPAIAVLAGALCGVTASVPVFVALLLIATRPRGQGPAPREVGFDYSSQHYVWRPPAITIRDRDQVLIAAPPREIEGRPHGAFGYLCEHNDD